MQLDPGHEINPEGNDQLPCKSIPVSQTFIAQLIVPIRAVPPANSRLQETIYLTHEVSAVQRP
jgi:hypothetical protein